MIPFQPRLLRNMDWPILILSGILSTMGLITLFSVGYTSMQQTSFLGIPLLLLKQIGVFLMALIAFSFFTYLDFSLLRRASPWFYGISIFLLIGVLFFGESAYGAQRWISIGPLGLQPSELAKLGFIFLLAHFLSRQEYVQTLSHTILPGFLLFALPFLLIFKQPDLGTALILLGILLGLFLWGRVSPFYIVALIAPVVSFLLSPVLWLWLPTVFNFCLYFFLSKMDPREAFFFSALTLLAGLAFPLFWNILKPYQQARFLAFLHPGWDPHGAGYHTIQSKIAIGSGGFFGKGFLGGSQTQLGFVPEQETDFIFSAIGEAWGFWMCGGVILLFFLLVVRIFYIASTCPDRFGSFLACGIGTMILLHFFINIGMTVGLLPVVGIPLPFLSSGGTSLVAHWISIGILESIAIRRQKLLF